MKILSLDSTAKTASICIYSDGKPLCVYSVDSGLNHSETLLSMVENALLSTSNTVDDIDIFAISAGPGSFTGVRIGVSLLKGLAYGKNKPCVPVSTLSALAQNLSCFKGIIVPVMDARRSQVYNAIFKSNGENIQRLCDDRAISLKDLENELKTYKEDIYFVGDGYALALENIHHPNIKSTPLLLRNQNAFSVAKEALEVYNKNPNGNYSDSSLSPVYLRMSQAEREKIEKENKI